MTQSLYKGRPVKALVFGKTCSGGRNNRGRITAPHRGGGVKRLLRIVDFKRTEFWGIPAIVEHIEYDPGRTARIALIEYQNGEKRYIIAPENLQINQHILADDQAEPTVGNVMPLRNIPQGLTIHNVELVPGRGGQVARSAGSYARVVGRDGDFIILRMRSGEVRKFNQHCLATIGCVSNGEHSNVKLVKAGQSRWRGIRPVVRGIAKNPVDHAMGGRTNGVRPETWDGKPTRGFKTRDKKKLSSRLIISRRKK